MANSPSRRIFDFFTRNPEVKGKPRRQFERWLLKHADDREIAEGISEIWQNSASVSDSELLEGWQKIDRMLDRQESGSRHWKFTRFIAAAAAAIVLFVAGFGSAVLFGHDSQESVRTLVTAKGCIGDYVLPDGTRVWLNGGSELSYREDFNGSDDRQVSLRGEGFFEVTKDSSRPFIVNMDHLKVQVLGTSFDARTASENQPEADVILENGEVKVDCRALDTYVTLAPGQRFCFNSETRTMNVSEVIPAHYANWRKSKMVFDNATLAEIIISLERRYDVSITMPPSISPDKRLSLTVGNESLDEIRDLLATLLNTRVTANGRSLDFASR